MSKTLFVLIALVVSLSSAVYGQELQKDVGQNFDNLRYLHFTSFVDSFDTKYLENLELKMVDDETGRKVKPNPSWLKKRESRWIQAFEKVVVILPESFFEKIGETSWAFFVDQYDWGTASPGNVNLLPSSVRPDWMKWEPLSVNGYSQEEMMFVALHELGHMCSMGWVVPFEGETTLYGRHEGTTEDFAETFALYVMWPEYLKENFPGHYEAIKTILVREYKTVYPMPDSIISRLTVKGHVANSH